MPPESERPSVPAPAGAPYGPNTAAVRRFLQRFAALAPEEWTAAAAAYEALQPTPAFRGADRALSAAVQRAGREGERDAVLGPLLQLVRVADASRVAPGLPGPDAIDLGAAPLALAPVAEAALAATLALVVHDVLTPSAFTTLYGPFADRIPLVALGLTE